MPTYVPDFFSGELGKVLVVYEDKIFSGVKEVGVIKHHLFLERGLDLGEIKALGSDEPLNLKFF